MPDFKEIKKNIEELKNDPVHQQDERKSVGSFKTKPVFMETDEARTVTGKQERKIVAEKQKVVPIDKINKLPVAQKVRPMTREEVMERREIFNDKAKKVHEEELRRLKMDIPDDRDHLVEIRSYMMEKYEYFDDYKVKHEDYRWTERVSQEIREHYDWLME